MVIKQISFKGQPLVRVPQTYENAVVVEKVSSELVMHLKIYRVGEDIVLADQGGWVDGTWKTEKEALLDYIERYCE